VITTRTVAVATSVILLAASAARPAHAIYYDVDALGLEVQHQSETLLKQLRADLPNAPQFSALTADAYQAYRLGGHVRELALRESSLYYVKSDLSRLEQLIANMERLTQQAELSAARGEFTGAQDISLAAYRVRLALAKLESSASRLQAAVDARLQPAGKVVYLPGPVLLPSPMVVPKPVIVPRPIITPRRVYRGPYVHIRPGRIGVRIVR
jgi:hypothetical protein